MTYNARIEVSADARKVEQAIDRIEQRLNRLRDRAAQISLGGISGSKLEQQKLLPPASQLTRFERATKAIADSAKRASTALKGLAVAGGALAGADAINALGKSLEKASVSIDLFGVSASAPLPALNQLGANLREATAGIEPFVQALQSAGGSGLTTAAGIATATTAFIAFEPAITAALDKLKIAERAFKLLSPAIKDTEVNFDGYIKKIRRATDVVSDLRESQRIIRQELDNVNSSTEEAADTAGAYVRVTERLNDELRAQADLLRQVRGFTVENVATGEVRTLTELEATKGRQSIATRQRAAEFRARQTQEQIALKKALERLDNESITRANTRLDLQAQLTQELRRTVDAAKFRAGQPAQQLLLPAFTERGLKILDDSVRLNESQLRIETALNGQRARGVRFLEKQAQEERRQLDLGITGTRSNLLRPGAANLAEQQAQALAASRATERLAITQKLQQTTSGVRTQLNLQLAIATKLQPAIAAITAEFERQLSIQKQGALLAERFSPIGGAENIPGSPAFRQARARRRKEALGSGIIGGAFPLLFGQGIGAAVGGGAGGAAGGLVGGQFGFGLALVGTALGTAVDTTISNISKLASSLGDPTAALEALQQAGVKVDESTRLQIKTLVDAGNAYDAQSLILREINDTLGPDAVAQLMAYKDESDKLQESFEEVSTEITMALVPALTGLLKVINGIVAITNSPQFKQALRDTARSQAIGFAVSNPMAALFSATGLGSIRLLNELGSRALPKDRPELSPEQKQIEQRRQASDKAETISLGILQQRNDIAGRYGDLLDEQVFKARKTLIENKALQDIQNLIATGQFTANKRKAIQITTSTALKELEASRNQQQDRANKKAEQASERALKAGNRAAKQAARLAERDRQRLERSEKAGESLIRRLNQEIAIKRASTPLDKELLQIKNETETVQIRIGELLNKQQQDKANELLQEKELLALTEARAGASLKAAGLDGSILGKGGFFSRDQKNVPSFEAGFGLDLLGRQDEVLQKFLDKYKQVGEVAQLTSELVTFGIRDMVAGTKTAEQVFADFLRNIADMLLKTAATMIAQYIALGIARAFATGQSPASYVKGVDFNADFFKFAPRLGFGGGMEAMSARANGGPVSTGTPYMVGERGPELFVPSNSGTIVPNNALGGDVNVVVNVTETQTDTRGNGARANQVGNALAAAVQAEIIKQKRPGGLLAN